MEALEQLGMLQRVGNFIADHSNHKALMGLGLALGAVTTMNTYEAPSAEAAPSDDVTWTPSCVRDVNNGTWTARIKVDLPKPSEADTVVVQLGAKTYRWDEPGGQGGVVHFSGETGGSEFSNTTGKITYQNTHYADAESQPFNSPCPSKIYYNYNYDTDPPPTQPTVSTTRPTSPPQTSPTTVKDIGRGVSPGTSPATNAPTILTTPLMETLPASTTTQETTTTVSTSQNEAVGTSDSENNKTDGRFAPGLAIAGISAVLMGAVMRRRAKRQAL